MRNRRLETTHVLTTREQLVCHLANDVIIDDSGQHAAGIEHQSLGQLMIYLEDSS